MIFYPGLSPCLKEFAVSKTGMYTFNQIFPIKKLWQWIMFYKDNHVAAELLPFFVNV